MNHLNGYSNTLYVHCDLFYLLTRTYFQFFRQYFRTVLNSTKTFKLLLAGCRPKGY